MSTIEVKVPDIGDFKDISVIDVLVKPGDTVRVNDALVTLESDKATMDIPSPADGVVRELRIKAGDRVSEGRIVLVLEASSPAKAAIASAAGEPVAVALAAPSTTPPLAVPPVGSMAAPISPAPAVDGDEGAPRAHASPAIRKLARELGVDLTRLAGSGPRGRILRDDVQRHVKSVLSTAGSGSRGMALELPPWPEVDFAKFGPIEREPLTRIQKISGPALARNWVMVPHVTQFDEADITDLERFRVALNRDAAPAAVKPTLLAFVIKACVAALQKFPTFNASLDGQDLVIKRYFHIGFAADTPQGLVVPVLRDADRKGVVEIARSLAELSAKARDGKLAMGDMQGGSFTISSLGGIGGTAFTPIINAPEVAILGVSRSHHKPVWQGGRFVPRLMLPLSLSYDHRVIDGALAARFVTYVSQVLADMRRAML